MQRRRVLSFIGKLVGESIPNISDILNIISMKKELEKKMDDISERVNEEVAIKHYLPKQDHWETFTSHTHANGRERTVIIIHISIKIRTYIY